MSRSFNLLFCSFFRETLASSSPYLCLSHDIAETGNSYIRMLSSGSTFYLSPLVNNNNKNDTQNNNYS